MVVIVKNKENYISFSVQVPLDKYIDSNIDKRDKIIDLRFIDSFKFMASSLDSLVNNLVKRGKKLFGLDVNYDFCRAGSYDLVTRNGVYPYEYMDSWDKFDETELPPIECFYSELTESGISEEDYEHAKKFWNEFNLRNLGDYHDLYLQVDMILLANVFKEFRKTCIKHYRLDPANIYTSPGLAWKACLKKT